MENYNPQIDGAVVAIRIYEDIFPKATLAFAFGGSVEIEWGKPSERNKYASGINAYTLYFDERAKELGRTFDSFIKEKITD